MEFLSESFRWLNDVFLKMSWLSDGVAVFVERIIGLPLHARTGASVHFFIYDTCKIFILLGALIYTLSFVQSYFPPERTRYLLGKMNGFKANVVGALLGTVTPFCSCSSIPLFIGFVRAGLPVGVTFSFLISSPLVDLASIILLASIFNWQIALVYVLLGLILAVVGGSLISALRMDRYVADFIKNSKGHVESFQAEDFVMTRRERHAFALGQVKDIVRRVWLYVVLGVAIGAVIHNWLPESLIHAVMGREHWYSVPLATLVGIPMYADIFGTLPIAEALVTRGVGLGTVLAFMMAVTALSLPSLLLLKQVIMPRLMAAFVVIVFMGILLIGTGLNIFSGWIY